MNIKECLNRLEQTEHETEEAAILREFYVDAQREPLTENEHLRTALAASVAANVVYEALETRYDKALKVLRRIVAGLDDGLMWPTCEPNERSEKAVADYAAFDKAVLDAEALLADAPERADLLDTPAEALKLLRILWEAWNSDTYDTAKALEPVCGRIQALLAGETERKSFPTMEALIEDLNAPDESATADSTAGANAPERTEPTPLEVAEAVRVAVIRRFANLVVPHLRDKLPIDVVEQCEGMDLAPILAELGSERTEASDDWTTETKGGC